MVISVETGSQSSLRPVCEASTAGNRITGADGFIGKNLSLRLTELGHADVAGITPATPPQVVQQALATADFVFHMGGVNEYGMESASDKDVWQRARDEAYVIVTRDADFQLKRPAR